MRYAVKAPGVGGEAPLRGERRLSYELVADARGARLHDVAVNSHPGISLLCQITQNARIAGIALGVIGNGDASLDRRAHA
jgi:hypothetical protein